MANTDLFKSAAPGKTVPPTDCRNEAGGVAYQVSPEMALAQLAVTGTFNDTFYTKGVDQLEGIRQAADQVSPEFLAKCAVYARQKGGMKDMPAALQVMLSKADPVLSVRVFPRVIDNGKMVRNLVQMVRAGAFHRKSMGSSLKRLVNGWIVSRSARALFRATVGNKPSLADVIRLTRPKGKDAEQSALIGYILQNAFGEPYTYNAEALPEIVRQYEAFKKGESDIVPDVDFRQLTSLPLTSAHWAEIARKGGWQFTRMNLNTFTRQGVFEQEGMTQLIAARLRDREEIIAARQFPYQILAAYLNTGPAPAQSWSYSYQAPAEPEPAPPFEVRDALHDALEVACENVPTFGVPTAVIVDVSGSMQGAITGKRKGSTSKVRVIDAAGLIGAAVLRKNPGSIVLPVDDRVRDTPSVFSHRDSVMTNAKRLAAYGGGATQLGVGVDWVNQHAKDIKLIVMVSDNESWVDEHGNGRGWVGGTRTMTAFRQLQQRHPDAKLVCIDIQPHASAQAPDAPSQVMNIGGFSDGIWGTIKRFVNGATAGTANVWVEEINSISLDKHAPEV